MRTNCVVLLFSLLGLYTLLISSVDATTETYEAMGWRSLGSATLMFPSAEHKLTFGLPIRNQDELTQFVNRVSDPRSPTYGQYLTAAQLKAMIGPSSQTIDVVIAFLTHHGASDIQVLASGEYITAVLPLTTIETLFEVEIHLWTHPVHTEEKQYRLAALTIPRIPEELEGLVEIVSGLRELPLSWVEKRKASHLAARPAATGSNAPIVTDLLGSQENLFITITPVCPNGNPTSQPLGSLCQDQQSNILGFTVVTTDLHNSFQGTYFVEQRTAPSPTGTWMTCTTSSKNPTSCILAVPALRFRTYAIDVSTNFPGGARSAADSFYNTTILASDWITPQSLHQQYSIPQNFQIPLGSQNRQAIASFDNQFWSSDDLKKFAQLLGIPYPQMTTSGFNDYNLPGDEAQLDVSMITALGLNIPTSFFSITGGWLIEWASVVLNQPDNLFPLVNSISYSDNEADLVAQYGPTWTSRVDSDFQKIAARGGSVVVAAGDAGATNIGHGASSCNVFMPQYPATSAYATAVGATGLTTLIDPLCGSITGPYGKVPCSSPLGEIVVAGNNGFVWTSGGGVSNITATPSWQTNAVNQYITTLKTNGVLPPQSLWNPNGRFYPDIAAIGSNLIIILDGELSITAGTSASTPIISGIFATLNAVLISHGKPPLGFVNPVLYSALANFPGAFNDVTVGNINCGDVLHPPHTLCCPEGWQAEVGYDAASGVGTPNWPQLVHYLLNLNSNSQ